MNYTTVDKITRSVLIQKRLPLHYYLEFAKYAQDCIRELSYDSLRIVNTVRLVIDQTYFGADLPCDFVDWVLVGVEQGQFIQPIPQRDTINNLHAYTDQGVVTTFGNPSTANNTFPYWPGYWMFTNMDDLGENTGRLFGWDTGNNQNAFKIIPERGQIQFTESFNRPCAIMQYISNGQTSDNATKVDHQAQACIEAYMRWRFSRNSDIDRSPEAISYANQRRLFRARKNQLTPWDIRQILYKTYRASIKN